MRWAGNPVARCIPRLDDSFTWTPVQGHGDTKLVSAAANRIKRTVPGSFRQWGRSGSVIIIRCASHLIRCTVEASIIAQIMVRCS